MMDFNKTEAFDEMANRLNGGISERANNGLKTAYRMACILNDEQEMKELEGDLRYLMFSKFPEKIPPFMPPKREEAYGEIEIGKILSGDRTSHAFGLRPEEFPGHVLLCGRTGSGKTSMINVIFQKLNASGIPCLFFDFKRDYRHLIRVSDDITVMRIEDFRWNPLEPPPNVNPKKWLQTFCEVFSHGFAFLHASKGSLMGHIHMLYDLYGCYEGSGEYPSVYELSELLTHTSPSILSKDSRYLETVRNRIDALVISMGETLDCSSGYPLEKLLEKNVVIELDGLGEDMQNFFVESMLASIFSYRIYSNHRGRLLHTIFLDESQRIFDRNKELRPASGIPLIDIMTSRIREFGEALVVSDQEPSKLTDTIKANTYAKFAMSLGNGKDVYDIGRCMCLDNKQTEAIHELGVGEAIVKLSDRYVKPFRIRVDHLPLEKNVTDAEVAERFDKASDNMNVRPRIRPPEFEEYIMELASKSRKKTGNFRVDRQLSESKKKSEFLISVYEKPFIPVSERYELLGLSARKGNDIKNELVSGSYLKEVELNHGKNGGRRIFLELLESAIKYLEHALGKKITLWKSGFLHGYHQRKIKEALESQGRKVELEYKVEDGNIDLVVDEKFAFEIAMSPSYEIHNIQKCLNAGFKCIAVLCRNEDVKTKIMKEFEQVFIEKPKGISFLLLEEFLPSNDEIKPHPTVFRSQKDKNGKWKVKK